MSLEKPLMEMIDNLSNSVPIPNDEYLGEDGFLHCSVCHAKTQTKIEIFGREKKVRCICQCRQKEIDAHKKQDEEKEIERRRKICFSGTDMRDWNFANDDLKNPVLSATMKRYADNFAEHRQDGTGLLMWGGCGTGKTYYAACIANELITKGYSVHMTNFATLINRIQGTFDEKQDIINDLNRYSLLIIDDLGAERRSEYMQEAVFNIIDARYRTGKPLIITTNLSINEIKNPPSVNYGRIYDRIIERCFPIHVDGNSRRRDKVKESYYEMKRKLGL